MTCIVGITDGKTVWMGGDSCASDTNINVQIAQPKVFHLDKRFLVGYCESIRMGQILQYNLRVPRHPKGMSDDKYMTTIFAEAVSAAFRRHRWAQVQNNQEIGGDFLVGYRGNLYEFGPEFYVISYPQSYAAIGSGIQYALGSLHTTANSMVPPPERVEMALDAASCFSPYVAPPYTILSLPA